MVRREFTIINNNDSSKTLYLFNNFSQFPFDGINIEMPDSVSGHAGVVIITPFHGPSFDKLKTEWDEGKCVTNFCITSGFSKKENWEVTTYDLHGNSAQFAGSQNIFNSDEKTFITVTIPAKYQVKVSYEITPNKTNTMEKEQSTNGQKSGNETVKVDSGTGTTTINADMPSTTSNEIPPPANGPSLPFFACKRFS
jgi:hypothetical protein